MKCPLCNNLELDLHDVDPEAKVKRYTDSPAMSFYSNAQSNVGREERRNTLKNPVKNKNSYIWNRNKFRPQRKTFAHFANKDPAIIYGEDQKEEGNGGGAQVAAPSRTQEIERPVPFEILPDN